MLLLFKSVMKLQQNMGIADRVIRSVIATILVSKFAKKARHSTTAQAILVLSGLFLTTSAVGSCPVYQALNIDSKNTPADTRE